MKPNCLVPGRLIEFSFDSFVEFGREKLQSHDSGAPDDFLRHAGDHIVSQLQERGRDRFHAASNAESPSDSLALNTRPRPFDSLNCGNPRAQRRSPSRRRESVLSVAPQYSGTTAIILFLSVGTARAPNLTEWSSAMNRKITIFAFAVAAA